MQGTMPQFQYTDTHRLGEGSSPEMTLEIKMSILTRHPLFDLVEVVMTIWQVAFPFVSPPKVDDDHC